MADMNLQIKITSAVSQAVDSLNEIAQSLSDIYKEGGLAAVGMKAFESASEGVEKVAEGLDEASKGLKKFGRELTQNVTLPISALSALSLKKVFDDAVIGKGNIATNAYAGAVQNLKKQFDNLLVTIGTQLAPAQTRTINLFTNIIAAFQKLNPETKKFITDFAQIAAVVGPVVLGLSTFIGVVSKIIGALAPLFKVLSSIAGALGSIGAIVGIAILSIASLTNVFLKLRDAGVGTAAALSKTFLLFVTFFNNYVLGSIVDGIQFVVTKVGELVSKLNADLGAKIQGVDVFAKYSENLKAQFVGVVDDINGELGKIGTNVTSAATFGISDIVTEIMTAINGATQGATQAVVVFGEEIARRAHEIKLTIAGNISGALLDIAEGAKTAEEAFRDFAKSTIRYLLDMILKAQIFKALSGFAGFNNAATSVASASNVPTLATGGHVTGPGTATSDSILARLSNGEYVNDAKTVKTFGVDFFANLKRMSRSGVSTRKASSSLPSFADGGAVSGNGAPQVIIQNSGTQKEATSTNYDPSTAITTIVLDDIQKNGSISKSIQRNFGVRRSSFK